MKYFFLLTLLLFSLSACSIFHPYTPSVEQGIKLTPEKIKQLQPGMTKDQITYLLGTPSVNTPYNSDQWGYVYSYQKTAYEPIMVQTLTLQFKGNKLTKIAGNLPPPQLI